MPIIERNDVWGIEFDWFAVDEVGHLGFFASSGSGLVPIEAQSLEAEIEELAAHLHIPFGRDSWEHAAAAGLYAYDGDINGGPYRLNGTPEVRLLSHELPEFLQPLANAIGYRGRFGPAELHYEVGLFVPAAV